MNLKFTELMESISPVTLGFIAGALLILATFLEEARHGDSA